MKKDFLRAYHLGFDWSGWIALIKSTILVTKGMTWPVSSDKWKEPLVRPFKWRLYWVVIIHDTKQGDPNTWACGCLQLKWLQCIRDLKIRGRDLTESFFSRILKKQTPLKAYCFHQKKNNMVISIDLFTNTAAILNYLDLRSIMGCPGGTRSVFTLAFRAIRELQRIFFGEKGHHYYIQARHNDRFSHYNLFLGKLKEKLARKARVNTEASISDRAHAP